MLAEIEYKQEQECLLEEWRKDSNKFYKKVDSLKNVASVLTEKSHQKGYIYYVYVESTGNTRGGYCKFIEPAIIFKRCQVRDYTFWIIPNTKTYNQDNLWEGQYLLKSVR